MAKKKNVKKKSRYNGTKILFFFLLVIAYLLLFISKTTYLNIYSPYSIIPIYFIVPVIAGIFLDKYYGFFVGLFASLLSLMFVTNLQYGYALVLPMALMGYIAGLMNDEIGHIYASFAIIPGQFLVYLSFYFLRFFTLSQLNSLFIIYESFFQIVTLIVINSIFISIIGID